MTAAPAQPPARPVLELVGADTPAGWSDPTSSELGKPLAEAAVLGCLLRTTSEHAAALLGAFVDEDLTVPQHRHVAAAARALLEQGHPVDPVTVLGQLRRQGTENARTASTDAAVFLVELCQAAPSVSSARPALRPAHRVADPPRRHRHAARPRRAAPAEHGGGRRARDAATPVTVCPLPGDGLVTTTVYLGTDLDNAGVWARAVKLRARNVLVLPDQDGQLVTLLAQHLGATA